MFIYILLLCIIIFSVYLQLFNPKYNSLITLFCVSAIAFVSGFRDMIGGYDIYIYASYFETVPDIFNLLKINQEDYFVLTFFEPGYYMLNSLFKTFINDKYLYFVFISVLFYMSVYFLIRNNKYSVLVLFIFFCKIFIIGFIYTRQILAMSFILLAYSYCIKNKNTKALILIVIASTIHYSAIISVAMLFWNKFRLNKRVILYMFLISFIIGSTELSKFIFAISADILDNQKLADYSQASQSEIHIFYFIESLIVFSVLYKMCYILNISKNGRFYSFMVLLYLIYSNLTLRDPGLLRLSWYYFIAVPIILSYSLSYLFKYRFVVISMMIIYFSAVYIRNIVVRDDGNFIPYKFYFLDTERKDIFA